MPGETMLASGAVEVAPSLPVRLRDRHDDLVDYRGKAARQHDEIRRVRLGIKRRGEHDRVIPPYRYTRTETLLQFDNLPDRLFCGDHRAFECARISGDGKLNHERRDPPHLVELGHERPHIPPPEHKPSATPRPPYHPLQ